MQAGSSGCRRPSRSYRRASRLHWMQVWPVPDRRRYSRRNWVQFAVHARELQHSYCEQSPHRQRITLSLADSILANRGSNNRGRFHARSGRDRPPRAACPKGFAGAASPPHRPRWSSPPAAVWPRAPAPARASRRPRPSRRRGSDGVPPAAPSGPNPPRAHGSPRRCGDRDRATGREPRLSNARSRSLPPSQPGAAAIAAGTHDAWTTPTPPAA
jgi:hypothetical protein